MAAQPPSAGSRYARRIRRVSVPQPVERQGQAVAPAAQCPALGEELVWATEPRILEDRKQQVIGIGCGDTAKIGLLREGAFERVDDRGEFADPRGRLAQYSSSVQRNVASRERRK